jgi:gluconolactonase
MQKLSLISAAILFLFSCTLKEKGNWEQKEEISKSFPFIEVKDDQLKEIIAPGTSVEIIAEGFDWAEGPLWIEGFGLLFSDIPPNKIYKWTKERGLELFLYPSGYTGSAPRGGEIGSNGLLLDPDGNLVLCQHGDRRMARLKSTISDPEPYFETIIDNFNGSKLNSPNDACFDKNGNLYFTDPPYGLERHMEDPLKELDFQGVYRYSASRELVLLTDELSRPNGIALSPDERTLYVANSDPEEAIWMAYKLNDAGRIEGANIFHDATDFVGKEEGLPDGLKVDRNGYIFASGPGGIWIFNPSGKVLGKIKTGQATSNCAFGEAGKALFITADMYVMKVELISG